jgi:predicted phosphodiesterase
MRLHVLSDLHTEFGDVSLPAPQADVVVLAGDTGIHKSGLAKAHEHFAGRTIIYVAGNHEYYRETIPNHTQTLRNRAHALGICFLENESLVLGDVAVLGCTLWTDFALYGDRGRAASEAEQHMTDYKKVYISSHGKYPKLRAYDTIRLHARSLEWLKEEIPRHAGRKIVVVTHHAPSARSMPDRFKDDLVSAAYASSLDEFVASSGVQLWIHGHVHDSVDYRIGNTRVVANPRGYPDERNARFQPGLVVEV